MGLKFPSSNKPLPFPCLDSSASFRRFLANFSFYKISFRATPGKAIIPSTTMATWFTVVGRVAQVEGVANSKYKNALIKLEEGDMELSSWRAFYVAFWGGLLESGRVYVILGTGRLTSNEYCSQPKFTATHAIQISSETLPVHYVQIHVAVDLKTVPKLEPGGKTYTFEGAVTGYYNDPIPTGLRSDRSQRSHSSHTTNQYFYADVTPRLERVLGSTNMLPSTKLFVDGDSTPGYIEARDITFNSTSRSAQGVIAADGAKSSGGGGGNRRNVTLKSSPSKPKLNPAGSPRPGPKSSVSLDDVGVQVSPSSSACTAAAAADGSDMSFALGEFGSVSEAGASAPEESPRQVQNKRSRDSAGRQEPSKRQRKPAAKV